jgi:hypothetical protein
MTFYYSQLGTFAGISAYRLFTFVFFAVILYQHKDRIILKKLVPLFVILAYDLLVMFPQGVQMAIFNMFDHMCAWLLIVFVFQYRKKLVNFFYVYHISMVSAFITGLLTSNSMSVDTVIGNEVVQITRFSATFEDPNYMGFFYIIGIFAMVTLKMYSKKIRMVLIVMFYAMIMFGLSITSIVVSAILWIAYFVVTKQINVKVVLVGILILFLILQLYAFALQNPDFPVIGSLAARISHKTAALLEGDMSDFTTERSDLSEKHMEFFNEQSAFKKLFGGNIVNTKMQVQFNEAAHNEYIDMLLNIGIIGTGILLMYIAIDIFINIGKAWRKQSEIAMFRVMSKLVWLLYAMTLTVFLDYRFFMFFII